MTSASYCESRSHMQAVFVPCSDCRLSLSPATFVCPQTAETESDPAWVFRTPGHTKGHVVLHYRPDKALLTGDHLMFRYTGQLGFSRA